MMDSVFENKYGTMEIDEYKKKFGPTLERELVILFDACLCDPDEMKFYIGELVSRVIDSANKDFLGE